MPKTMPALFLLPPSRKQGQGGRPVSSPSFQFRFGWPQQSGLRCPQGRAATGAGRGNGAEKLVDPKELATTPPHPAPLSSPTPRL